MQEINLLQTTSNWIERNEFSQEICLKDLYALFRMTPDRQNWNSGLDFKCECGCGRRFDITYHGFHSHFPDKTQDHVIAFSPDKENIREREANHVDVAHFSNGVDNFKRITFFLAQIEAAMNFKKNFNADIIYSMDLCADSMSLAKLLVVSGGGAIKVLLHQISEKLPIVFLDRVAENFVDRLGMVFHGRRNITRDQISSAAKFKSSVLYDEILDWGDRVVRRNNSDLMVDDIVFKDFKMTGHSIGLELVDL